jgi:hypothetical protein
MTDEELKKRFAYHPPKDDDVREAHETIRFNAYCFARLVVEIVPAGREQALALTAIEEAMMWGNAGIARNQ